MAVGVPHPTLGEAVVVCATQTTGERVTEDEVRSFLKERLSAYKVPRRVLFVDEDELTFTTSQQKVQLEALRVLAVARLVEDARDPEWAAYLAGPEAPLGIPAEIVALDRDGQEARASGTRRERCSGVSRDATALTCAFAAATSSANPPQASQT